MGLFDTIFGKGKRGGNDRRVAAINDMAPMLDRLSDAELIERFDGLRDRVRDGALLDSLLVESFAITREAADRTLGLRHFDVQIAGGMALHDGQIAEMKTGEGKTLVATLPACLNALSGEGVHVVTVNDYLAQRDADWMGPLYNFLGLSVGVILEEMGASEQVEYKKRNEAYAADITYGTNHEIAFDYLRDNLALTTDEVVQRGYNFAIVDEVDFLLVDEARTPLIISGSADEASDLYRLVDQIVCKMREGEHYTVEPKSRSASLTELGFEIASGALGVSNLCDLDHLDLYHAVYQSVLAHGVYQYDVDYIVEGDQVFIVDEFTGRVSEDKRYAAGLHQAIEAKEGVTVRAEDQTLAKVTYQTFFGRYQKIAGMTGTAWSERQEFRQTYGREVKVIPTNRPLVRRDFKDRVYDTLADKHMAMVEEISQRLSNGQPVLVGTTSVRESEQLSRKLTTAGVPHEVLNAKNHRAEAAIVAQAGRLGAVTISTNMAGRGTDIVLGGNPEMMAKQSQLDDKKLEELRIICTSEREQVVAAGGLHVIGTAHHDSVRIDDQLRGRAGRQGDPGDTRFMVSLDDEIWKRFGKKDIARLRTDLKKVKHPPGEPIVSSRAGRVLSRLQKQVDVENQAIRRDVLKYDLVVHVQRESIYGWRKSLVVDQTFDPKEMVLELAKDLLEEQLSREELALALKAHFHEICDLGAVDATGMEDYAETWALNCLVQKENRLGAEFFLEVGKSLLLDSIDTIWTEHLSNLERIEEGIGLRGYGGVDPILEFKKEAAHLWQETLYLIRSRTVSLWFLAELSD